MKTRSLKRLLSLLLCLCLVAGLLPGTALAANASNAGPNPNATTQDNNTHIIVAETATNDAKFCPYTTYSGYIISAPAGMSYDLSTNTLTLNNYNGAGYYIQTNMMGSDFKVQLIGTNVLDGMDIWGFGWGCGLTFTGSGTLTVNSSMTRSYGLQLNGEGAEPILHVSQESTVTVYGDGVGHAIFLEGSTSLSASPITYGGTLSGGTPVAKRPNLRTGDVDTGNGVISCLVCTKNGDSSGTYYGFATAYSSIPVSITYNLWKLTGTPASGFTFAEKVMDESTGQQVSYVSTDGQDPPPGVLENYTMVQEDLANWSISSDGDFLHPATVVIFSPSGAEVPDVLSITTTSLPGGTVNQDYPSTTLTATGYDPAKALTWTAEGLPDGLTLSTGGVLSGTPAESGSFIVKVTAQVAGSGATGTTARRSFVLSIASNPFLFTLDNIDPDVYGKQCYLKGETVNGTNLTLWSGELKQGTTSLPVSDQCLGATMAEVNLIYYYSGGAVDLATYTGSITLSEGGRADLTGKGDVLVALPEIQFAATYPGVTGSFGFQITSGGFSYSAGSLAPKGTDSWFLTAYLNYNPSEASTLYDLDNPIFSGPGVEKDSSTGRYTYTPTENSGSSPITITLTESKLREYTVTLTSSDGKSLPDLSGARLTVSQSGMYGTNTATATVTYDESTQTNSAKMQLYSGNASVSLIQSGKYAPKDSTVNIPADSSSVTVDVVPSELKDMSLAISAVPEADALAEYARLLGQQNSAVTISAGDETAKIGSYNILTESPNKKTIYSSSSAALYDTLYENGGTCTIAWEESGPVHSGQQEFTWKKGNLSEHAILEVSLKGGVLAEVTNQSSTVYFTPWWYNPADKSWHMGASVRAGVGQTAQLALWCPGSTGTEADWNLLLVPQGAAITKGLTWGEAKTAYWGMPFIEDVSIQDNAVVTTAAPLTVNKTAVDNIQYPLQPYSTFVGPDQFDSTDDLLVYTGHIQVNEVYEAAMGGMTRLRLDAAGTDSSGRVATQISSVVVNGVEYPYTKIQLETEPPQKDQLVSIQFQTYYQIDFSQPVELPCDITVYAKPMLEASDAVLQLSVKLENHSALQLVNTAVVKAPDLSVSLPSVTGGDTVTAYVTAPSEYPTVRIYDGDELVATSDRNGSVQIPLCGTSKSMTTSHRLTFRSFNNGGAEGPSVTKTVLHADGLPTVTAQHLLYGNRDVSRNTVYSFTSSYPAPFRMTCTIENAENIAGNVSFAVRFLDGTIRYIEAKRSGKAFTTEAFTSSSPVIGAQVLYEIDWDKVQAAMNANLNVPGNTLGGSNSFESTIVLPWSDYKNELTQYQEAFQYLEDNDNKEDAQKYQDALKTNGDEMKNEGTLNFGRAESQDPVDVNSGAKTAQEMFDYLDKAAITDLKSGQTLYTGFTRQVTQAFFQAELGSGSGFSRLILADGDDIKYEMYVKLIELANKEGTGTLVLAADYVTGGDGNPLYMEIGSVAVQGIAATAAASNGQSASAPLSKSGGARNGDTSTPSSGGYYFTDIGDDQTMSAMDYASCVSDGYVTGMNTGLDVINTAGYYIDGTVDSVGTSGFAAGGYTTALAVAGVGKATYDTAVNYSTLGDLYTMSANLLNSPCAQKLAQVNPGFISNMQNQLTEYKAMLDDAGAWNIGMGAYNVVNGAVGAAGGYAIPWVTLATAGLGMFGDAIVKQKVSNCEATGTVLYDTMQLFIKKYANQYDDPECKGGSTSNPEEPYRACIDPSGVVYEAVLSNPVEGATVTLYTDSINYAPTYQTTKDDKTGATYQIMVDQYGNPATPTNADSASAAKLTIPEENSTIPAETVLTTGADGRYQWMVTEGLWYVTAHKEGYQDGNSGNDVAAVVSSGRGTDTINWLPVSPEQLNVNIPLVSYEAPTVTAEYRSDGVYLTFSKYMDDDTLTANNFTVYAIGEDTEPIQITVKKLNSEKAPDNIDYNGAAAGYGTAPSYTSQIKLAPVSGTLSGKIAVIIGSGVLSYAGVPYTSRSTVNTISGSVSEGALVTPPTLSHSGGQVAYGSTVTITIPKGAAVYYTTDGTTPSATNGTRYYAGQTIPITQSMTLKAVAVKYDQTSSTVTANFTVPSNASTTVIGDPSSQPGTGSGGSGGGGGGGGGGGSSSYSISVPSSSSIKGGSITVSPQQAAKGDTVTITVTPDKGYELEKLTVTDAKGNELTLTEQGNGKYVFTMPGSSVKIEVSFREAVPIWESCTGGAECPAHLFTDVNTSAWYHKAVDYVLANGLMSGYGNGLFGPDDILSRAQLCQIIYNLEGQPATTSGSAFTDVADGAWYADAVTWAASQSIVGGYGGGLFGPEDNITREQLAAILYRYAQAKGYDTASGADLSAYGDASDVSSWAIPAMQWACGTGVIMGVTESTLLPQGSATRAQVATMLMRFCEYYADTK